MFDSPKSRRFDRVAPRSRRLWARAQCLRIAALNFYGIVATNAGFSVGIAAWRRHRLPFLNCHFPRYDLAGLSPEERPSPPVPR